MQTRLQLPLVFIIAATVLFSSCSKKTNKEGRYIPKNASVAILLNGESLSSKLPWEEIKQNELYKSISADSNLEGYLRTAIENPENTGVDAKKNLLFFAVKDSLGGYFAFEGTLKDADKFKAFNMNANKTSVASEKDGIHFLSTTKMTSSWDKDKFVIIVDVPQMSGSDNYNNMYDSSYTPKPASKRNVLATVTDVYNLSEDNSLAKDEKFSTLVGTKGDVHFWVSVGSLASGNKQMAALSMLNMSKLYEASYFTGVSNFENGKIVVDIKSYVGKELADIYKKYSDTKINTDMIKRIPGKDVAALFALSFKPEGLKEFIKLTGMEGFINIGTAQLGFNFDDFIKANKGDIMISVSDIKKDSSGKPDVNAIFAASIADKNSFGKLIEAGNKVGKEKFGNAADNFLSYNVSDNYFAIGTNKASVDKFISTANNNSFDFLDKAAGSSSLFYLNIPMLMSALDNKSSRDSLDNIAYEATLQMWGTVIATGEGFKDGAANQHLEINLVDKNTNSLKQLNKYIGTMGRVEEQKKKKRDTWMNESMNNDSTIPADSLMVR